MALRRVLGGAIALAAAIPGSSASSSTAVKRSLADVEDAYDYIVVGGGTSGLVVASRLSEDPKITVLAIEYGDIDTSWEAHIPGLARSVRSQNILSFSSVPQTGLDNSIQGVTVGAVVGGGSQVNGMAFDRGSKSDYDSWEDLGNPGWGWDGLFKYFKKATTFNSPKPEVLEKYHYTSNPETYGKDGPIQITFPSWQWPDGYTQRDAWINDMGVANLTDHGAGGTNVGCAFIPSNIEFKNATRSTSRTGYYDPASSRPNLHLLVRHYVSTIAFEDKTASGVNVVSRGDKATIKIKAKKEIILAAGAIQTPRILQLSGVGPAKLLKSVDVDLVEDLPGVGANFQDHPYMVMIFNYGSPPDIDSSLSEDPAFAEAAMEEYMANRTGPLTQAQSNNMVFLSLQELTPDYQAMAYSLQTQNPTAFLPEYYAQSDEAMAGFLAQRDVLARRLTRPDAAVLEIPFGGGAGGLLAVEKPLSRGTVMIKSKVADPAEEPLIDFGAMQNPIDMAVAVAGVKIIRKFFATPSLAVRKPTELVPGPNVQQDEDIAKAVREGMSASFAHPCCTAHMGPRELGGVVDPELRVYGVKGLRVVDASVIPLIPACHLQSTVYAIAEKAADIIKGI